MIRNSNATHIIRMEDVSRKISLKPSSIYALIQAGKFPKPFKITPGGRASGWLCSDIESWLLSRAASLGISSSNVEGSVQLSEDGHYESD